MSPVRRDHFGVREPKSQLKRPRPTSVPRDNQIYGIIEKEYYGRIQFLTKKLSSGYISFSRADLINYTQDSAKKDANTRLN